jgi:hypothetical protein
MVKQYDCVTQPPRYGLRPIGPRVLRPVRIGIGTSVVSCGRALSFSNFCKDCRLSPTRESREERKRDESFMMGSA